MNQKLIDLAVWLRANPVPNLDMVRWRGVHACGKTHCIIGWVAENQMFGFQMTNDANIEHVDSGHGGWEGICRSFGISYHTANWLFSSGKTKGMSFDAIVDRIETIGEACEF